MRNTNKTGTRSTLNELLLLFSINFCHFHCAAEQFSNKTRFASNCKTNKSYLLIAICRLQEALANVYDLKLRNK